MGIFDWLQGPSYANNKLPIIFPFPILQADFCNIDLESLYARILTDVLERTHGLKEEHVPFLFDNCMANEANEGLITLLSKAMVTQGDLFLVYDAAVPVLAKATNEQMQQIKEDYKNKGQSDVGVYITFKNYKRTQMLKIYSVLEYCTVGGLYKILSLARAIQLKFDQLRATVGVADSNAIITQAKTIAESLQEGRDIMIDGKDMIETAKPDLTGTDTAMAFITKKKALYSGMPASYIDGDTDKSLGDTGEGDAKKIERGLKAYYFSIIAPVLKSLWDVKTTFKSDDFYGLSTALDALRTFESTTNEFISGENKLGIVNKLFGLPEDAEGDEIDVTPPPPPPPPQIPPGQGQ